MQKLYRIAFIFLVLSLITISYILLKINSKKNEGEYIETNGKYVLMAVNTDEKSKLFYFFYLPFATVGWRLIGFKTIILLVTTHETDLEKFNNENPPVIKTIDYLKELGAKLVLIKAEKDYALVTSMICRLYVGALDFLNDEDYVITSDSDLIPVKESYYFIQDMEAITAWNAFCCGNFIIKNRSYEMYPMGHIGMKKKHWKGVMEMKDSIEINTKTISDLLRETYDLSYVKKDNEIIRGDATWNADQAILSSKIAIYVHDFKKSRIIKKPYEGSRFDRSDSDENLDNMLNHNYNRITDVHAFHKDYLDRWPIMKKMFKRLFGLKKLDSLNMYYLEFKGSIF